MRAASYPTLIALAALTGATVLPAQLTPGERTDMLVAHDTVREDEIAPVAVPLLPSMTWSASLETTAQSWAANCVYAHSGTPGAGENLYASSGVPSPTRPTPASVVSLWASEKAYYTYATNSCNPPPIPNTCGHYTQVVWRASTQLGCGIARCTPTQQKPSPFCASNPIYCNVDWYLVVCQYSPAGNNGSRPYLCDYDGDGSATDVCDTRSLFADGFASGDFGGWSSHLP